MRKSTGFILAFALALVFALVPLQAFAEVIDDPDENGNAQVGSLCRFTDEATGYTYEYFVLTTNGSGGGTAQLQSFKAPAPDDYDENPDKYFGTVDFTIPSKLEGFTITSIQFGMPREIKSVTIPATVTTLKGNWQDGIYLKTVTFASGSKITEIPESFFRHTGLTSITLPDSVTTIASWAFGNCFNLQSVKLPSKLKTIGDHAFYNTPMDSITFPNGLITIGDFAFANQKSYGMSGSLTYTEDLNLKSVVIPDSVTSIGAHAFASYDGVHYIINDPNASKFDRNNYTGMTAISSLKLGSGLQTIGEGAFAGANITKLTLPASLKSIGDYAFSYCINLKSVDWSNAASAAIETVAGFDYCYSLKSFVIPASTKTIGDEAFSNSEALTGVVIPEGVKTIGRLAFAGITKLGAVVIPSTVTTVDELAFRDSGMSSLTIKGGSAALTLGYAAFSGCKSLAGTTIELPKRVAAISDGTFAFVKSVAFVVRNDALRIQDGMEDGYSSWRISSEDGTVDMADPWGSVSGRELLGDTDSIVYYPNTMTKATSPTFMQYLELVAAQKERADNPYAPFDRYGDVWPDFVTYNAKTENPKWEGSGSGDNPGGNSGSGDNPGGNSGTNPGGNSGTNPGGNSGSSQAKSTTWTRLAGAGALDTMAEIINAGGFAKGGTVVLASLEGYWDALTAAGIAGLEGAPVVMALQTELGAQSAQAIKELAPKRIIVCGGPYWIPDSVVAEACVAAGIPTSAAKRLSGDNAALTAGKIAAEGKGRWSETAIVATAGTFQDALAAAPVSWANKMPIFLAQYDFAAERGYITSETIASMKDAGIKQAYIAGGTYWLPKSVTADLEKAGIKVLDQLGGASAVETSGLIANLATSKFKMSADNMGAANVAQHYDALASAAFCGKKNSVLVLVADTNRSVIDSFAKPHAAEITNGYVFGGTSSVSDASMDALVAATS